MRTVIDAAGRSCAAWSLVGDLRPAVVVGVGGYASLPAVAAARLRRIPVVVHESDAHPGLANRIAVRLGRAPGGLAAWHRVARCGRHRQPDPARDRGRAARAGVAAGRRRRRREPRCTADQRRARSACTTAGGTATTWSIHHVTGARDYEGCRTRLDALRTPGDALQYRLVRYEDHMDDVYRDATVMVSRGRVA